MRHGSTGDTKSAGTVKRKRNMKYVRTEQERLDDLYEELITEEVRTGLTSFAEVTDWYRTKSEEANCNCTPGIGRTCKHGILARMSEKEKLNRS